LPDSTPQDVTHSGGGVPQCPPPPASLPLNKYAFFLDIDGTLIEPAPYPEMVAVDADLLELLNDLAMCSGDAVALVSGRRISTLDILLEPLRFPTAGLHGFERRNAAEVVVRRAVPSRRTIADARRLMQQLLARNRHLVLEDRNFALALHYGRVPHLESAVIRDVKSIADLVGGGLGVRQGRLVVELSPSGVSKATAIAEFMSEPPFKGRWPLYLGDYSPDEPAFEWVNAAGGLSVAVNVTGATAAGAQLRTVSEARAWVRGLITSSAQR